MTAKKYYFYIVEKKIIKKLDILQENRMLSDMIKLLVNKYLDKEIKHKVKKLNVLMEADKQ